MYREKYFRTNEQINYYISNGGVLLKCIDYFCEKDSLTSREFLQSFIDLFYEINQNFVQLYLQKSTKLNKDEPGVYSRLFFSSLCYRVGDCSRLLKSENNNEIDKTKFVERLKIFRNFGNWIISY